MVVKWGPAVEGFSLSLVVEGILAIQTYTRLPRREVNTYSELKLIILKQAKQVEPDRCARQVGWRRATIREIRKVGKKKTRDSC